MLISNCHMTTPLALSLSLARSGLVSAAALAPPAASHSAYCLLCRLPTNGPARTRSSLLAGHKLSICDLIGHALFSMIRCKLGLPNYPSFCASLSLSLSHMMTLTVFIMLAGLCLFVLFIPPFPFFALNTLKMDRIVYLAPCASWFLFLFRGEGGGEEGVISIFRCPPPPPPPPPTSTPSRHVGETRHGHRHSQWI